MAARETAELVGDNIARYGRRMRGQGLRLERRRGFSLVEALVVLAVSGMALTVVFSIGSRAGETGFALGRRALAAADQDLSTGIWRTLLDSALLMPIRLDDPERVQPVVGVSGRLEAEVVTTRATPCAPRGWRGRMVLTLDQQDDGHVMLCQAAAGPVVVMALGPRPARFRYSLDGMTWLPDVDTSAIRDDERLAAPLATRRVFVRLEGGDQASLTGEISSGRPETWVRPDDFL